MDTALLEIRNLAVDFATPRGTVQAVRGVSLEVQRGECLAVVGESGSGKSQLFLGCLGLLAARGSVRGVARFDGRDLLGPDRSLLDEVRGTRVALVFQDPMNALTPHLTIGRQLTEVVLDRGLLDADGARARSLEVLRAVRLPDPEARLRQYPHELSGGQRQRVAIAMALMTRPDLIVADEPTTALDVTVQAQVLDVLREARDRGLALVLITHDLGVVAGIADRVAVMYAGRIVEVAPVRALFAAPAHPYTAALLASVPRLDTPLAERLASIDGQPPHPGEHAVGCAYAPRCPAAVARCRAVPPELQAHGDRAVACHAPLGDPQ
ncbi:MAG: ABC transporter ATP-binding protein [Steroidobacteraceae bacterium]|nr:ABC transporter ATP-binding protein [Steroidobacteraceae bacterium]